jgi:hypothetical protein
VTARSDADQSTSDGGVEAGAPACAGRSSTITLPFGCADRSLCNHGTRDSIGERSLKNILRLYLRDLYGNYVFIPLTN